MPNLLSHILRATIRALPILLVVSAFLTMLPVLMPNIRHFSHTAFAVLGLILFHLHRQVMFDLPMHILLRSRSPDGLPKPHSGLVWFLLACGGIVGLIYLLSFKVMFLAIQFAGPRLTAHFDLAPGILHLVARYLPFLFGIALLGPLLPAAVSGRKFEPFKVLIRTLPRFPIVALQLLAIPMVIGYCVSLLMHALTGWAQDDRIFLLVGQFVIGVFVMLPVVAVIVILVRSYEKAFPAFVKANLPNDT